MSIKTKLFTAFIGFTWLMVILSWIFPNGNWVFLNWLTMAIFGTWALITIMSIRKVLMSRKEQMSMSHKRGTIMESRDKDFIKISKRRDLR